MAPGRARFATSAAWKAATEARARRHAGVLAIVDFNTPILHFRFAQCPYDNIDDALTAPLIY